MRVNFFIPKSQKNITGEGMKCCIQIFGRFVFFWGVENGERYHPFSVPMFFGGDRNLSVKGWWEGLTFFFSEVRCVIFAVFLRHLQI